MKRIKGYKDKHLPIPTAYLMSLIAILSVASCQKNCNHSGGHKAASMIMEIDEYTLKGREKTIRIAIKNDGEAVTRLDDFRLKAKIVETGGTGSGLAYPDADNNPKSKAEVDEVLTHFVEHGSLDPEDSVNVKLQVQPGAGVSHAVINLELYDTSKGETVATETVTWSAASYQLSFINIPAKLKNDKEIQFQIQNEEDEVSTDEITVCLISTKGVKFELNGQKGDSIEASLTDILGGSTSTLAKGISTSDITLKLADAQGKHRAKIKLELKKAGNSLAQKNVKWSVTSYQLSFIGIPDPAEVKDNEEIQFQIKNEGDEVSTDDITVCLTSTKGVKFELNGQKGDSIEASLTDILGGSTSTLAKDTSTSDIILKLADAQGKNYSEIKLELKKRSTLLDENTVKWSATPKETDPHTREDVLNMMNNSWSGHRSSVRNPTTTRPRQ